MKKHKVMQEAVAANTTGLEISALTTEVSNALATFKNYDVVNNSWGTSSDFLFNVLPQGTLEVGVAEAVNDEVFEMRRVG